MQINQTPQRFLHVRCRKVGDIQLVLGFSVICLGLRCLSTQTAMRAVRLCPYGNDSPELKSSQERSHLQIL
jgi:hypothetical protein